MADMINEIGFEASLVVADELGLVVLTIEGMRGNEQAARDIENNCLMVGIEEGLVECFV